MEVLRAQAANPRQRKCQDHMQIAEQRLGFVAARERPSVGQGLLGPSRTRIPRAPPSRSSTVASCVCDKVGGR